MKFNNKVNDFLNETTQTRSFSWDNSAGTKLWYKITAPWELHREDGPAITWNGSYEWWTNGKLHKEDGPAIDPVNGNKEWYLHGIKLTEREHNMFIQLDQ